MRLFCFRRERRCLATYYRTVRLHGRTNNMCLPACGLQWWRKTSIPTRNLVVDGTRSNTRYNSNTTLLCFIITTWSYSSLGKFYMSNYNVLIYVSAHYIFYRASNWISWKDSTLHVSQTIKLWHQYQLCCRIISTKLDWVIIIKLLHHHPHKCRLYNTLWFSNSLFIIC